MPRRIRATSDLFAVVAFGTRQTLASYLSMHTGPDTTASAGHFESGALGGPDAPAALATSASASASAIPFETRRRIPSFGFVRAVMFIGRLRMRARTDTRRTSDGS